MSFMLLTAMQRVDLGSILVHHSESWVPPVTGDPFDVATECKDAGICLPWEDQY